MTPAWRAYRPAETLTTRAGPPRLCPGNCPAVDRPAGDRALPARTGPVTGPHRTQILRLSLASLTRSLAAASDGGRFGPSKEDLRPRAKPRAKPGTEPGAGPGAGAILPHQHCARCGRGFTEIFSKNPTKGAGGPPAPLYPVSVPMFPKGTRDLTQVNPCSVSVCSPVAGVPGNRARHTGRSALGRRLRSAPAPVIPGWRCASHPTVHSSQTQTADLRDSALRRRRRSGDLRTRRARVGLTTRRVGKKKGT